MNFESWVSTSVIIPIIGLSIWSIKLILGKLIAKSIEAYDRILETNRIITETNKSLTKIISKDLKDIKKQVNKINRG